ncbi:c(7)-type cytochrome triheme domain-containing protein [Candidatus Magnetominusculus dajiuhuensis]|uniref:c(7)-type cytochrome triheme domain-containing protein n=1 Tax=Candidatus Magnetominusculus dajiuhuensis TaxID=3137712 RepID=UPI003B42CEBF
MCGKIRDVIAGSVLRVFVILFVPAVLFVPAAVFESAYAVPPGKILEWECAEGKVVFEGTKHAGKGIKCTQCHLEVFRMRHGVTKMTMKEMDDGAFCGACHNGKTSFSTSAEKHCAKCHVK